jgi:hypothetical protein
MHVQPEFYAMMMFAQAAPPGSTLLRVANLSPPGIETWATRAPSGDIHVVVINKHSSRSESMSLHVPAASGPAAVERLQAPSLAATGHVTLGGQTFGAATRTGVLAGTPTTTTVVPLNDTYTVNVPGGSAVMLTMPPSPTTFLLSTLASPRLLPSSW